MPSNCSKAWVCANISRRSARMVSVPWWSGFAPTPAPRLPQPPSGAARLPHFSSALFDVIAQFGDRTETERALRQPCFDRAIGIERIRHTVDNARLEHRCRAAARIARRYRRIGCIGALLRMDRRGTGALGDQSPIESARWTRPFRPQRLEGRLALAIACARTLQSRR